jgi:hypothetical protein
MDLNIHPNNKFSYIPAINAYSSGVAPLKGFKLVGIRFDKPTIFSDSLKILANYLPKINLDMSNIVSFEFRSPMPFSFNGFSDFNKQYYDQLGKLELLINDINPIARTNVSPLFTEIKEPVLFGLHVLSETSETNQDFVVAGSGEVKGDLDPKNIIARADLTQKGVEQKVLFVLEEMKQRLFTLKGKYIEPTEINVYTVHEIPNLINIINEYLPGLAKSSIHVWKCAPPILEVEFEMDLRRLSNQVLIN